MSEQVNNVLLDVFKAISAQVPDKDGWCKVEKAHTMAAIVMALRPTTVVEIGVWFGRSLIPMAMAVKALECGRVIAIDPWSKEASTVGMDGEHLKWWSEVDHERIYQGFIKWLHDSRTMDVVEVFRGRSDQYPHSNLTSIELLHVDGNHSDKSSCYDVEHYATKVPVGGIIACDDFTWAVKAYSELPEMGFKKLYTLDTTVFFQRIHT